MTLHIITHVQLIITTIKLFLENQTLRMFIGLAHLQMSAQFRRKFRRTRTSKKKKIRIGILTFNFDVQPSNFAVYARTDILLGAQIMTK